MAGFAAQPSRHPPSRVERHGTSNSAKERFMSVIRHHTVTVHDGTTVFVREAGDPDRPVLVLLHGFPSSSRQFLRLMDRLAERWHLVAPDYPGFGQSDPLPSSPTFDRLA